MTWDLSTGAGQGAAAEPAPAQAEAKDANTTGRAAGDPRMQAAKAAGGDPGHAVDAEAPPTAVTQDPPSLGARDDPAV